MQGECVWFGKRDVPYRDLPIVTRVDTVRSPMERRYFRDIADDRGLDWEYCGRVLADRDIAEYMRRHGELLERNDRVLADMGFSRELLEEGVSTWPWRGDLDRSGTFEPSNVTPEMVKYHIANGRQLRAREVHRLARKAAAAVARAGRVLTGWARDRRTRLQGEQNPR